jgi:hypothetical protein
MAIIQSNPEIHTPMYKTLINWLAATLGLVSVTDLIPIFVGVLSAAWIVIQLYGYLRYELPFKRAKLAAARKALEAGEVCETP